MARPFFPEDGSIVDSRLDSIFRTTFQPAERTDTRQGIRREEPPNDQRRRHHEKQEHKETPPEDNATLSVIALHGFLNTLLLRAGEQPERSSSHATGAGQEFVNIVPDGDNNKAAARAANAYQTTARSAPGAHINLSDSPPAATVPEGHALPLSAEELRVIHQLLHDVGILAERGIGTINLPPAERFLDSLAMGVRAALQQ